MGVSITFGKRARPADTDIEMPVDDDCLYHCVNYAMSHGDTVLTRESAMRLQEKVVARIRRAGLHVRAVRLLKHVSAGYPDEEDFDCLAAELGFS